MKTYEELTGAQGRRVFYRAERYRVQDLFKKAVPEFSIDRSPYALHDLSLSGLSGYAPRTSNDVCEPGARVAVQLGLRGIPLFEGTGEVARIEPTTFGTKIAVKLLDCLNVSQLISKYQEIVIRTDLAEFGTEDLEASVSPEYRMLCADILHLLRTYRANLERFAETRPDPASAADMLAACEERILPVWRKLWHRGNELVAPLMINPEALRATKRFTELVLTPEFMAGAIWKRSYEKPLGYPGDFRIMNMVYDWRREGSTPFEQLVHRIGLDVAECIATRMVMMRQAIANTVLRPSDHPARIATLGCGPAREIVDYLQIRDLPQAAQFTLIDQDYDALSLAYERTYPETIRLHGKASVNCLHTSFGQLLKAGELFGKLAPQDLIYTVGLIDYLAPRRAKALVTSLYQHLAPGGTLIVGNMMKTNVGNLWPMEFITDWNIIYRDHAEMEALTADITGAAEISTALDPTGRVVLVTVKKPA
jgi:SAM-dependent methyltransferase